MSSTDQVSMRAGVTAAAIDRSLRLSVLDGVMHAVMLGLSESYIGAFAVELGHGDAALALLMTVPMLVGALGQLTTATFVSWLGSRKRFVVISAFVQAASHVLLLQIALRGDTEFTPLLVAATLFWGSGLVLAPAWSSWMGALTRELPGPMGRERYFSRRYAVINVALLLSFSGGGFALSQAHAAHTTLATYSVLFLIALFVRLISVGALSLKIDPDAATVSPHSTLQRVRIALGSGRWRVAVFVAVMMFGAHVSVPFFTPFMLRTLQLGMLSYSLLCAVALLCKALSFSLWRRIAEHFGMHAVLLTSVVLMTFLPVQWVWASSLTALTLVQLVSGVAWGGFEYASLQLLLRDAPPDAEVEFFSLANSASGVLQVLGALVGSAILMWPVASYHTAFIASSILRGLSLLLLVPLGATLYQRVR